MKMKVAVLAALIASAPLGANADVAHERTALYAEQAVDCTSSGVLQQTQPNFVELFGPAKYFAHGGITMYCLGVVLQDLAIGAGVRRWRSWEKNVVVDVQITGHGIGIHTTFRNWRLR